jgi:hypothetical protein
VLDDVSGRTACDDLEQERIEFERYLRLSLMASSTYLARGSLAVRTLLICVP